PSAAGLPRNSCRRGVCVAACRRRGLCAVAAGATIYVADQYPSFFINSHVKEVEQVAADVGAAVRPNIPALHRSIGRRVTGCPGQSAVESMGDIKMPDALEAAGIGITSRRRAIEGYGGTTCIAGDGGREPYII